MLYIRIYTFFQRRAVWLQLSNWKISSKLFHHRYTWKLSISQFQPRKSRLHKAKMHEAQLELRSQKNHSILQLIFRNLQFKVKQSKRNSIQCFSETLIVDHAFKKLRHSLQQDPRVDFGVDFINSKNTIFLLFIHLIKKKKMNEEAGLFGVCFPSLNVCLAYLPALQFCLVPILDLVFWMPL